MSRYENLLWNSTAYVSAVSLILAPIGGPVARAQNVLPQGGSVVSGSATISQPSASALSINQSSLRAIINWNSFSVGAPNSVTFSQPNASASALNRVLGSTPSSIAGQLNANGQIFLVNPNGIAITPSGTVTVGGGFVASTLDIANIDFMAGNLNFRGNGASAGVNNEGSIRTAPGGFVGLLGGTVSNTGKISVPLGKVGLGSGEQVVLDLNGDGFMQVAVPTNATTSNGRSLLEVAGSISAAGGKIEISAATVAQAIRDAVNVSGSLSARSMAGRDGAIALGGGLGGNVEITGSVSASGHNGAGAILITGADVALSNAKLTARSLQGMGGAINITAANGVALSGATIDATGATGGGLVRIGGAFQGGNADPSNPLYAGLAGRFGTLPAITSAKMVTVDAGSKIDVSATRAGNGGTVVLWADQTTSFAGNIYARGGASGGNGGFVETSSHNLLDARGMVTTLAPIGNAGTWLLDPTDMQITTTADANVTGATPFQPATASGSVLTWATINAALAGTNVVVQTTAGFDAGQLGIITIANGFTYNRANSLTFTAANNIVVNGAVTNSGAGALTLTASGTGSVAVNQNLATTGGTITINAGSGGVSLANGMSINAGSGLIAIDAGSGSASFGTGTLQTSSASLSAIAITNATTLALGNVALTGGGQLTINHSGAGSQTAGTVISGTNGKFVKAGGGTFVLSNANIHTGLTTVAAGTLSVTNATGLGTTAAIVTIANGATLDINGVAIGGNPVTVGGTGVGGNGAITGTGTGSLSGAITLALATTIGGSGTLTLSGVIEDNASTFALTKTGSGTLVLSGNSGYDGGTNVNQGVLNLQNANAAGNSGTIIVASGAAVQLQGGITVARALTLNGTGISNDGALRNILNNNTWSGAITLGSASRINSDAGLLTISNGIGGATQNLTIGGAGNTTVSSVIGTTTGTLTKDGGGTLTLTGGNTYTGLTTVSSGTLAYGASNVISTGAVTVDGATAVLALGANRTDTVGTVTVANGGSITGTGTSTLTSTASFALQSGSISAILAGGTGVPVNKTTAGTVTLSGNNTYTGVTTINAGVLSVATIGNGGVAGNLGQAAVAAANLVLGGGTLQYTGATASTNRAFTLTNATTSSIDVTTNNLTISGAGAATSGALTKIGAGTLTLSGTNLYTGLTTVSAGTLNLQNGSAIADIGAVSVAAAGTLNLLNNETIGSLTGVVGAKVTLNANTLTTGDATNTTFAGVISGSGGLTKQGGGTFTLSGVNTYTGVTTINAGVLSVGTIGNGGVAGNLGQAAVAATNLVLGGGTLQYTGATASTDRAFTLTNATTSSIDVTTNNLTISGAGAATSGALTKIGAGTLTLSGTNLYTGLTTVSAGTLVAQNASALGTIATGTTVAAGATLEIANGITIGAETLNVSGAGVGSNGALVVTSGSATYGGNVTLGASASIGGNGSLTLGGTVNDHSPSQSVLTQVGIGTLTFGSAVGATINIAKVSTSIGQTTAINGGSVRTSGLGQTYGGIVTTSGATTLTALGGGPLTANNPGNNFNGTLSLSIGGPASIVNSNTLALGTSSVGSLTAQTLAGDITLNGAITASGSGNVIVLAAAGNFINNVGPGALSATGGRWLVYSTSPAGSNENGLVYDFKQYNAPYATAALGTGNGFLYTLAPTVTAGLTGTVSKTYNGNDTATLAAGNYTLTSGIDGDTVTLNNPASGNYIDKNVGTGKLVTVTGLSISATNGAATVYGYQLTNVGASVSANIGTITPAPLSIVAASDSRQYNGTTTSSGLPGPLGLLYSPDTVTGLSQAFTSKNVLGSGNSILTVTAYTINDGNFGNNYAVTLQPAAGTITPAPLSIVAASDSRQYNGTTTSSGLPGPLGLLYSPDTVTGLSQAFTSKNVLGSGNSILTVTAYTINDGNFGNNYAVTLQPAAGTITPAPLSIVAASDSRQYNGTTTSSGLPGPLGLLYSPDTVTGLSQAFTSKNVLGSGNSILTVTAYTINDGNFGNNYAVTLQPAAGTITPAPLSIVAASDSRQYNGTTTSSGLPGPLGLLYSPDTVTGLSQAFTSKNVLGSGNSILTVTAYTINDGNFGNNYAVTLQPAAGTITPAPLSIVAASDSRQYNGTTTSSGLPGPLGLLYSPDTVTGLSQAFTSKNVLGSGNSILTVTAYTINDGNFGNNYAVTLQPAAGTITPAPLSIVAASDSRQYNGTTTSSGLPGPLGLLYSPDTVTGLSQAFTSKNVLGSGNSILTVTAYTINDGNFGNNYAVTLQPAAGTITQATITVAGATNVNKPYDTTTVLPIGATGFTYNGVYAVDTPNVTVAAASAAYDSPNVGLRNVNVTGLGLSGSASGNYQLSATSAVGSGTIGIAALTYSVANATFTFGTLPTLGATTLTGVLPGDTVTPVVGVFNGSNTLIALSTSLPVGTYSERVTALGGPSGANYIIAATGNTNGTLTIQDAGNVQSSVVANSLGNNNSNGQSASNANSGQNCGAGGIAAQFKQNGSAVIFSGNGMGCGNP